MVSGIGTARADQAARILLAQNVEGLISWGTAAALISELKPGDLIVPETILSADDNPYAADQPWLDRIWNRLAQEKFSLHRGPLTEAREILHTPEQKYLLHANTGAAAADMETAVIMKNAVKRNLPCIAIRAIVDESDKAICTAVARHTDPFGNMDLAGLLREIFQAPRLLGQLTGLALSMQRAVKTLKTTARKLNDSMMFLPDDVVT